MQVICPHCGEPVSSDHINIQRMAAVCPACNSVFKFELPDPSTAKIKQRKVKPPQRIDAEETDGHLKIVFRTNFRLDKNEAFLSGVMMSAIFTFITSLMLLSGKIATNPAIAFVTLGFALVTLMFYYWTALVTYNKTHIDAGDEEITVSRKPLPAFLSQDHAVSLAGVKVIRPEETPASRKEVYDTPRYNVWAEMVDGHRRLIVGDLVEDYAVFVAQRLNEFLDQEAVATALDVSHLSAEPDETAESGDGETEDVFISDELPEQPKSLRR